MGSVFSNLGQYEMALDYLRNATTIREKSLGRDHPLVATTLTSIADVLVKQGRAELALKPLERVLLLCKKKTCDLDPYGKGLFLLAQALVATNGDKARANNLVLKARAVFGQTPKRFVKEVDQINAWMKRHGVEQIAKGDK